MSEDGDRDRERPAGGDAVGGGGGAEGAPDARSGAAVGARSRRKGNPEPRRPRFRITIIGHRAGAKGAGAPNLPLEPRRDLGDRRDHRHRLRRAPQSRARALGQPAAPRARCGDRRVGPLGQRLVPADRRARLLVAVEHARVLPALSRRSSAGLGRVLGGHYVAGWRRRLARGLRCARSCSSTRLAEHLLGEAGARRAVLYLAVFPTSLYLGAVYSESLFLALALATFVLAERGRLGLAGVAVGLALLTRAQGARAAPRARAVRAPGRRAAALRLVASSRRRDLRGVPARAVARDRAAASRSSTPRKTVWDRELSPLGPARRAHRRGRVRASSSSSPSRCRCSCSRWSPGGVSARRTAATRSVRS